MTRAATIGAMFAILTSAATIRADFLDLTSVTPGGPGFAGFTGTISGRKRDRDDRFWPYGVQVQRIGTGIGVGILNS